MIPKVSVKFRRRDGIPYAVEQFSGRQYRCRLCNEVFLDEKALDGHLARDNKKRRGKNHSVASKAPRLNESIALQMMYVYDVKDALKREWFRSKHNDVYEGVVFSHHDDQKGPSDED